MTMTNQITAKTVAIIGSGEVGVNIFNALIAKSHPRDAIMHFDSDPSKIDQIIAGRKVHHTERLTETCPDLVILGYSANHGDYESHKQLLGQTVNGSVLSAIELFQILPEMRVWPMLSPTAANKKTNVVKQIIEKLGDTKSKSQYRRYFSWICNPHNSKPPEGETSNQYFDNELIKLTKEEVFVDCGAFIGDTLDAFLLKTNNTFKEYYAFEPDKENFIQLIRNLGQKTKNIKQKVMPFNGAISNHDQYLEFLDNANQMSQQTAQTGNWVKAYSLGTFDFKSDPTFIKLDLEGQETTALRGFSEKILKWRPKLCVAIYHNPSDFIDIPINLMSTLENYTFHVRAHNKFGLDFVLYCCPKETKKSGASMQ